MLSVLKTFGPNYCKVRESVQSMHIEVLCPGQFWSVCERFGVFGRVSERWREFWRALERLAEFWNAWESYIVFGTVSEIDGDCSLCFYFPNSNIWY